ncbi:MAG: sulfurtransferase [Pseudomonadales bacterium]|nr:sulfurtransferase [Pseudomonadales bacterium]
MNDRPRLYEPEALASLDTSNWLVVHVAQPDAYVQAHLPGARLVTPRDLVMGTPPAPGRLPTEAQLEQLFSSIGYERDRHIVTYDDEGGGWAGRFAWTLDVIGHHNWGYINGGIHALAAAGVPLTAGPPPDHADTAVSLHIDTGPIAEIPDVLAAIGSSAHVVLDARSREEFLGTRVVSARGGHVPGAVNIDWMRLQDPARETRLVTNLAELLGSHGVTPDKRVITHCQTHHRSGLTYMAARLLGYPNVQAYHGSWSEWGNRNDTPVETGEHT